MKESEIIIVNHIPSQIYYSIIKESVMYAIISVPFTVNRMNINDLEKRITNISKGKIAEKLFEQFCLEKGIVADFKTPSTPFYKVDKRDFLLDGFEWDIKNNFIHHDGNKLEEFRYIDLPALIPNRFDGDQWSKKDKQYFENSKGVKFLFTFLKATDKNSRKQFVEINLSSEQKIFLNDLIQKFAGKPFDEKPFTADWFWKKMKELKDDVPSLQINDLPNLVIAGVADETNWDLFKPTNIPDQNNFLNHVKPQWYQVIKTEKQQLLKFLNGTIWTRIPNATLPVSKLKAYTFPLFEKGD